MKKKPAAGTCQEVSEANFEAEVIKAELPVLLAFYSPWSHPCQILESALDEAALACAKKVKVLKLNADNNPALSLLYDIQFIPSLLFFVNGTARATIVGTASKEAILTQLQAVWPGDGAPGSNHASLQ